jgi:hypothetical protein
MWPDSKIGWKKPAIQTAQKILKRHNIDIVVSSSPPITGHMIAMEITYKHHIPWVADFRDFWESRLPEQVFGGEDQVRKAYQLLRDVAGAADMVTRINDSIGRDIFTQAKTIAGGYDPDDFEFLKENPEAHDFSFCYLGTVGQLAPMEPFFQAARIQADRNRAFGDHIRFRFIGVNDTHALKRTARKYGWKNRIEVRGYLTHRIALREAAKSSVYLLSVPSEYPFITTGKLYDYMALPGTILAAVPPRGEAAKLIEKYHAGYCADPENIERLGAYMVQLYDDYENGRTRGKSDTSSLTRIHAAKEFAAVFNGILDA